MNSDVERYNPTVVLYAASPDCKAYPDMENDDLGKYVKYSDYLELVNEHLDLLKDSYK